MVIGDNGTELTLIAMLSWCHLNGTEGHYITLGKPRQNRFVENFNGRVQDEP